MPIVLSTTLLLTASNLFMTFAWYGHLKNLSSRPWYIAALISWGIAGFEYLLQVPANRLGHTQMSVPQFKIIQEVITLPVFAPFAVFDMQDRLKMGLSLGRGLLVGRGLFCASFLEKELDRENISNRD